VKFISSNKLLHIFQTLDFIVLQGITGAVVHSKLHMMCNGANLAFKKKAFEQVNGYNGINHIASGDDMLLMHKIWKIAENKVFFLKSRAAIIKTLPVSGLRNFIMQRKRWASKTFVYDDYRIIAVLLFVFLYNIFLFSLFIAAILHPFIWICFIIIIGLKTCFELSFFKTVAKFYEENDLVLYFILFQPIHIFYTVIIGLISQFGKYQWKGRRTH
jgi:cellulose synthase/poly-beta-1,6-N-acetylglucosamine synthase-like glycosyltransferase